MSRYHSIKIGKKHSDATHQKGSSLYSALMTHWCHQDSLLWSRTQFFIAIQVAIIAASFSEKVRDLAKPIFAFGISITIVILIIMLKDWLDREANILLMKILGNKLLPYNIKSELSRRRKIANIQITSIGPSWYEKLLAKIKGGYLIISLVIIFIGLDFFLLYKYF